MFLIHKLEFYNIKLNLLIWNKKNWDENIISHKLPKVIVIYKYNHSIVNITDYVLNSFYVVKMVRVIKIYIFQLLKT